MANVRLRDILMGILNHVYPFIADQGNPRRFICLKGPVYVQAVHPLGCKVSEKWWKPQNRFPIKWRWMPSPLSGQHQNNLIDYFKMFERLRWVHFLFSFSVLFPHPLFCCETLYRSGIKLPLKVPQSSHDLISAPLQFQFASAGAERLVSLMWLKDAPVRMKTCMPPPSCLLFYKTSAHTDSPISDWLCRLLLCVCNKEIHSGWNTATTKTLIPFDIYSPFHKETWESFLFY